MTDNIKTAEEAMGFEANTRINLLDEPMVPGDGDRPSYQRHIAIEWEGGVIWLNTFDLTNGENPHYCIDVRQFNTAGQVKGEGVFTMARGYRGSIAAQEKQENAVKGHGWEGGYVVCILTDPDGQETHTDDEREK
jgi:hypothetical protein